MAARGVGLPTGTVTLLFTDIEGSTALLTELGDSYGEVLADHHRLLRGVWLRHDGVEVDTEGDAFFVAFSSATLAVRAAAEAQRALAQHGWPHRRPVLVRMGVHTGEPRERDGTYWGIDVHYAARLCSAAHGGQVLLSAATRERLADDNLEDLGEHALKDFPAPRHIYHLVVDGRSTGDFPPPRTLELTRTNLPSVSTPIVGRERELRELEALLVDSPARLVTLAGPGGTGKTRMAIACGGQLLDSFADGVFLAELARVSSASGVAAAIAAALGAPRQAELGPEQAAIDHLKARRLLLIVDNFEHVLDAAPLLGRLLDAAPDLRVLATSQSRLRLTAEKVLPVEPLVVPMLHDHRATSLAKTAAVRMFVERARAADPSFALTDANAPAVAELCRRLEGLPLALELAAARVRVGGPAGLLSALERGLDTLGRGARDLPERQRGLRAALDWTISQLAENEQRLFAGLGVFASAWTIEQADAIFGDTIDTWEALASLIDFSLVHTRGDGRMTMAERVRTHSRELLSASGLERESRCRHAELMAEALESLNYEHVVDLNGVTARTQDLVEEIELAIEWTRGAQPDLHRRLVAASGIPLFLIARWAPLRDEIAALVDQGDCSDAIYGRLLMSRGVADVVAADYPAALQWTRAAVDCHHKTGTPRELLTSLASHTWLLTFVQQDSDELRKGLAEALELAAGEGDERLRDHLEGTFALVALAEGAFDEAEARLQAIIARPERTDFAAHAAMSAWADCALRRGNYDAALTRGIASLTWQGGPDPYNALNQLREIAAALAGLGRDTDAAELLGAVDRAAAELAIAEGAGGLDPECAPLIDAGVARVGEKEWERRRMNGRRRSLEEAIRWVSAMTPSAPAAAG